MAENDIIVRIRAEGQEAFVKQLKEAGVQVEATGKKVEKEASKMGKAFGDIERRIAGAFAVGAIIEFTRVLAKTAIDIDATNKKIQTVFGESTKIVEEFAKKSANSLGLTINEYKRAAAAVGDLLVPIGFQRKEAAKLSNELISLSGALSAWTGGQLNATQVSDILTKALLGEREQLKTLGIQISEADVSTRLLAKNQDKLKGTALAQAKAMATLELITEKSADAQAAFADDTKTLAETQQELTANVRQLRDTLATGLIPVLNSVFGLVNDSIEGWRRLIGILGGVSNAERQFREEVLQTSERALAFQEAALYRQIDALDKSSRAYASQRRSILDQIEVIQKQREALAASTTQARGGLSTVQEIIDETNKDVKEGITQIQNYINSFSALLSIINEDFSDVKIDENLQISPSTLAALKLFRNITQEIAGDDISTVAQKRIEAATEAGEVELGSLRKIKQEQADAATTREQQIAQSKSSSIDAARTAFNVASGFIQLELQNLENARQQKTISEKQYQEERSALLTKQAKADKANAVFEIGLNTSQAITAALTAGPIAGPILAGIIGALAAAQLAQVLAAPIPQFAKGTKGQKKAPAGFAWVGEEGPELVQMKGGEKVITAKDSEVIMKALAGYGIPVQFKPTEQRLNKPMKRLDAIMKENGIDIDWNPLLMSNEKSRFSLGRKLDKIHDALVSTNHRKMTRA